MEAFPKDSMNMALGGSGPLRSRLDLDKFHGRGAEGFSEYAATRKPDTATMPVVVNPHDRAEQVHGDESFGLGTSTFLEGAPASRKAVAQRRREMSRKKSLAQRLRGMSNTRRQISGDARSPGSQIPPPVTKWNGNPHSNTSSPGDAVMSGETTSPPRTQIKAVSAGGPARARARADEVNPFFDVQYDAAFERKGAQIAEAAVAAQPPTLTRSVTNDGTMSPPTREGEIGKGGGGGLLSRMRSLKGGGRRARPERRDGA
ncbi:MAG: hypothetical protein FE78DRAFT_460263 [Acidomyces sp. 'richmondensis']|nr:MAG: hypothetical protein FE78DRAFT_460263 [Acidomyces sp. 'richmondensis']